MKNFIPLSIILYSFLLRYFFLKNNFFFSSLFVVAVLTVYFVTVKIWNINKLGLLAGWAACVLPWQADPRSFINFFPFWNNFQTLLSPQFLIFDNNFLYLSFLPFVLWGIYEYILERKYTTLITAMLILILMSLNISYLSYPMSYLIFPFIAAFTASGLYKFQKMTDNKVIYVTIIFLFVYDIASYLHFFVVHYPKI